MADLKISQLTTAASLTGSELLPIVQSGSTVKTTVQNIADLAGGGGGIEDILYASLYNKVVNGELVPGQWYRLTDYRSVNFLNGWSIANSNPAATDPNFNPREIYIADPEILILQAISPYQISEIGYSETYQGDIIQYEPYTNKIGVNLPVYNGYVLPNATTVSGFDLQWDGTNVYFNMPTGYPVLYGHYLYIYAEFDEGNYYQDGVFTPVVPGINYPYESYSNSTDYLKPLSNIRIDNSEMKVVLLDLTEADYNNYDADSLFVRIVYAIGDAYGWISRRQDTYSLVDVPFDFKGRKYRRFEVNMSSLNSSLGTGYYGQGDNWNGQGTTGNYKDFKTFNESVNSFTLGGAGGPDINFDKGSGENCVFLDTVQESIIHYFAVNNTTGTFNLNKLHSFNGNTCGVFSFNSALTYTVQNNLLGFFMYNTIIGQLGSTSIGSNCMYNNLKDFTNNTVGNNFQNNTLNSFTLSTIGNDFNNNFSYVPNTTVTISNGFQQNIIYTPINFTDFTGSTYVYGAYNCTILKNSGGSTVLSVLNSSNVVVYFAVNA